MTLPMCSDPTAPADPRRRRHGRRHLVGLLFVVGAGSLAACSGGGGVSAGPDASAEGGSPTPEAGAYVWGYPLVVTRRTLQTFAGLIGVNQLYNQTSPSTASTRLVVSPNVDTLYSVAVLDLRFGARGPHRPRRDRSLLDLPAHRRVDELFLLHRHARHGRKGRHFRDHPPPVGRARSRPERSPSPRPLPWRSCSGAISSRTQPMWPMSSRSLGRSCPCTWPSAAPRRRRRRRWAQRRAPRSRSAVPAATSTTNWATRSPSMVPGRPTTRPRWRASRR